MKQGLGALLALCLLLPACEVEDPSAGLGNEVVRAAEIDWSFARELPLAALQTSSPPRSRAVWILVHGYDLYIPTGFERRATWPAELERDPVVLLRVMDRLYLRHATRVKDADLVTALRDAVREKYGSTPPDSDESSGFFRMDPAPSSG